MTYTQTDMSITLGLALVGMVISYFLGRPSKKKPKVEITTKAKPKQPQDWDYIAS